MPRGSSVLDLLDSSLIVTTNKQIYNAKIIHCNDYIQVYFLKNKKMIRDVGLEPVVKKSISIIDTDNLVLDGLKEKQDSYIIEKKNIIRSKLECQRLAKANIGDWKTFITLTFADNIIDLKFANKRFRYFIDKIQRIKKDFKYLCIPEFQKRGATHYHMLCNIDINDKVFIFSQEDNPKYKHIKFWIDGFTNVQPIQSDPRKIIGYIAKYMTKDIDNRLFNCHRYFYSRNLNKPSIIYFDLSIKKHLELFNKIINEKEVIYENNYLDCYNNEPIVFQEYL